MKYILVNAHTTSEWDSVSFALIELSPEREAFIKTLNQRQLELKVEGIDVLGVFCDNADFYNDESQLPQKYINEDGNVKAGIVKLTRRMVDKLTQPEQSLKYGRMEFLFGGVKFTTHGKHTGEEFYTDSIELDENGEFISGEE